MPKYVPEPYKIAGAGKNVFGEIISLEIVGADGFPVAELPMTAILPDYDTRVGVNHWAEAPGKAYVERDPEEVLATAQLLSAAPELLKALKNIRDKLGSIEWADANHAEEILITLIDRYYSKISKIIAKAEGRE